MTMKVVKKIKQMQKISDLLRKQNKKIGFVPTMGALHKGHIELIKKAREENDIVVVSIFVNPIQFGPKEDYKKYPRPIKQDLKICRENNVDYVFYPEVDEMYPPIDVSVSNSQSALYNGKRILTFVEVEKLQDILCGKFRPGHFRGVCTVVTKLFNIVKPHRAYFGEKDYQQLKIIQRMVKDLNFDIEIIPVETVREDDGLACSSRNTYLSKTERKVAFYIYKSLLYCKQLIIAKKYNSIKKCIDVSKKYLHNLLFGVKHSIQYFEVYYENLNPVSDKITKIPRGTKLRIFVAVYLGTTRLIDNIGFTL
jgi:pantoate--beta-alanine ligase